MKNSFPLFQSHIDLAHDYWSRLVQCGDHVIDATTGNGYDTLKLCQLALSKDKGKVYAFDVQRQALEKAKDHLSPLITTEQMERIEWKLGCHSLFSEDLLPLSIQLIVYNLGYLPGGDKAKTTQTYTTLLSLEKGLSLLKIGGALSVTTYPGHAEGKKEHEAVITFFSKLSPKEWSCCHHQWINRLDSPTLFLIQKNI